MRRIAGAALLSVLASCNARSDRDITPRDSGATPSASAETPRVLGACCPDADADLIALMQRYESTPERERPPEVAIWPYRMTSGIADQQRIIVRDSASWARLWPRIVGSHSPRPTTPAVNFETEMLLIVSMGTRSSGGYVIAIDSVSVSADTLRVVVREQSPGPRCGTPAALSAPVALARIMQSERQISFTTRAVVRDCP